MIHASIGRDGKMNHIVEYLRQLLCNHEWIFAHVVESYFDYSGYKVTVWRCYCPKCHKWRNRKFY